MDIAHPLRSLIPSLDSAVLEVLAGTTRPLSGHQVAQLARTGSASGVRLVLHRLVDHGLVTREDRGRSSYFTVNRDHLAWPAIEELLRLDARLEDRIVALVDAWAVQPASLAVFGSVARHEAGPSSDIDLVVIEPSIFTESPDWDTQLVELATAVENWSGNHVQFTTLTLDGLAERVKRSEPIVGAWLTEARTLAGRNIHELIAGVEIAANEPDSGLHAG